MVKAFQELIANSIPYILPAILVGSWLVNHKAPSSGGSAKAEQVPTKSEESKKEESAPAEEKKD
jgi:hypothetical protein